MVTIEDTPGSYFKRGKFSERLSKEISMIGHSSDKSDVKPAKAKAKKEVVVKVKAPKARKAKANEPRELSAKELAALQFIAFPVGNGAMAYYPAPKAAVADEAAV